MRYDGNLKNLSTNERARRSATRNDAVILHFSSFSNDESNISRMHFEKFAHHFITVSERSSFRRRGIVFSGKTCGKDLNFVCTFHCCIIYKYHGKISAYVEDSTRIHRHINRGEVRNSMKTGVEHWNEIRVSGHLSYFVRSERLFRRLCNFYCRMTKHKTCMHRSARGRNICISVNKLLEKCKTDDVVKIQRKGENQNFVDFAESG